LDGFYLEREGMQDRKRRWGNGISISLPVLKREDVYEKTMETMVL